MGSKGEGIYGVGRIVIILENRMYIYIIKGRA